uniref:Conserved oligomeric Golgi complex subunit 8 n=1 Tax=Melanopsichium pennsylvanicum 4 TaxID=1398559 RepID=A0A077RA45_9BASI|nr:dor1-domain-containing protein [Melanopsichium pennsylvanicum 4]
MATSTVTEPTPPRSLTALIHNDALTSSSTLSLDSLLTKQVSTYIHSLSNFSLADLRLQPQQLQSKSDDLHHQLSQLCVSQTDAFIRIHHAEQQFSPSLTTLATHLDHLLNNLLPNLQTAAQNFVSASQPVLAERHKLHNVADQYERGHLSDLLDIPPLVHTCVKAGHYAEAIQLTQHLISLLQPSDHTISTSPNTTNHGQRNTFLSLLLESLSHLATIKADLISSFHKPGLKLPSARKSVIVLRKLNSLQDQLGSIPDWTQILAAPHVQPLVPQLALTQTHICLAFLKARIKSFSTALDAIGAPSTFSSQAYLTRYIDLWRQETNDTLGMAFSLFIDDAPPADQPQTSTNQRNEMVNPAYLISSFAISGLEKLRTTIEFHLNTAAQRTISSPHTLEILAETYANVHTQLSYASAAMTRFGFEFGSLLFSPTPSSTPPFDTRLLSTIENTYLTALTRSLDATFSHFQSELETHVFKSQPVSLPSRWLISTQLSASSFKRLYTISSDMDGAMYDDFTSPNIELVDYPPLTKLVNRLVGWLNVLQVFAPISISHFLLSALDDHFARLSERLLFEIPQHISKLDQATTPRAYKPLLEDEDEEDELRLMVEHLEERDEMVLRSEVVREREEVMLGKVLRIWNSSVVHWIMHIVKEEVFDVRPNTEVLKVEDMLKKIQEWIEFTEEKVGEANKQRRLDAIERKRVIQEKKAAEEEQERVKLVKQEQEQARLKAKQQQEEEQIKLKAEAKAVKERKEAEEKAAVQDNEAQTQAQAAAKSQGEKKKGDDKTGAAAQADIQIDFAGQKSIVTQHIEEAPANKEQVSTEEPAKTLQKTAASGTSKKFSLAEKLRLRKEERDRALAAAAAAANADAASEEKSQASSTQGGSATGTRPGGEDREKETIAEDQAQVDATDQHGQSMTEVDQGVKRTQESKQDVDSKPKGEIVQECEQVADQGETDGQDELEAGEEDEESGADTPTTPATPTMSNFDSGVGGSSAARSNKKKKNNKKKK